MTDEINIDNISHLPQTNIPPKDIPDNILLNTRKQLHQLDLEAKLEQERKDAEEEQKRKEKELKKFKFKELTELKKKIMSLTQIEYIEIYKIIKNNNEKFSQNKNGVLFNFMKISDKTIEDIKKFIFYIENNNVIHDKNNYMKETYNKFL